MSAALLLLPTGSTVDLAGQGARPSNPAAVSGVVVDGDTGQDLPGVVVAIANARVAVSTSTVTDSKGRFVFRDLPPADGYVLSADREGYASEGLLARPPFSPGARIALESGDWFRDVRLRLWRYGGLSGRVLDERGEPIVDQSVWAIARVYLAGHLRSAGATTTRTDDRGRYRIGGLIPGDYVVMVPMTQSVVPVATSPETLGGMTAAAVAAGAPLTRIAGISSAAGFFAIGQHAVPPDPTGHLAYASAFYPNAPDTTGGTAIRMNAGEERDGIDFAMLPVPAVSVSGRLVGDPRAVSGNVVRLVSAGAEDLGLGAEQATALVEADGAFHFAGVPAGRYTLLAGRGVSELKLGAPSPPLTPGYVRNNFTMTTIPSRFGGLSLVSYQAPGLEWAARQDISIGAADVDDVVLEMTAGVTIRGRVTTEDGSVLRRAVTVSLDPTDANPELSGTVPDRAVGDDPNGAFALRGVRPGQYLVRVFAGSGLIVKSVTAPGATTSGTLVVRSGDVDNVVVTLTDKPASVRGRVLPPAGSRAADAAIILFPTDVSRWEVIGFQPDRVRTATCIASRAYQISRLPAGEYAVIAVDASLQDAWNDPRFFRSAAPVAEKIVLTWGGSTELDLIMRKVSLR